ncbi:hypothetical protein SSX86_023470 [Deinandra increscens subsp. villosa]|uniref:Late embryogenesis abundant protein LEA-2 subgroup domain-containing protein n=1 Tax=Deinandra increscens subsp. villosa TaxID=3103831 RepID=A0AAP0CSK8_9ASTR
MVKPRVPAGEPTGVGPRCSILIKSIITLVLALIVMIGLAILIIWLSLKPRRPYYIIKGGSINNFTLTKDHHLNASYNLVLKSFNPSKKMQIQYKKMEIKIMFGNVTVASGVIDSWHQHKREKRDFKLELVSRNVVLSGEVSGRLGHAKLLDEVVLGVEIKSRIRSKMGMWRSRYYNMKVSCGHVVSQVSNSSKGAYGSCSTFL